MAAVGALLITERRCPRVQGGEALVGGVAHTSDCGFVRMWLMLCAPTGEVSSANRPGNTVQKRKVSSPAPVTMVYDTR